MDCIVVFLIYTNVVQCRFLQKSGKCKRRNFAGLCRIRFYANQRFGSLSEWGEMIFAVHRKFNICCLPFAGGSSAFFAGRKTSLPEGLEMTPIELPGRGRRIRERLLTNWSALTEDAANQVLAAAAHSDIALFGHSMGALLAFDVCRILENNFHFQGRVVHLFVSGSASPEHPPWRRGLHLLEHDAFRSAVLELGGATSDVFDDPELSRIFVPILRADFAALDSRPVRMPSAVNCRITTFYGSSDPVTCGKLDGWRQATASACTFIGYGGSHFFVMDHYRDVTASMKQILAGKGEV